MARVKSLYLLVLLVGCGGGSPAPAAPTHQGATPNAESGSSAAAPPDSKFACHLNCSGQEKHGYGATEEEARADASRFIESTCKPEDGQYFLVCNPTPP